MFDLLQAALESEIAYIQGRSRRSTYTLSDGKLLSITQSENEEGGIVAAGNYRFEDLQMLNLPSDSGARFTIGSSSYRGFVSFCDRSFVEVIIAGYTAETISSCRVEMEVWRLLELQKERLAAVRRTKLVDMLMKAAEKPLPETGQFVCGQENAIAFAENNPVTVVWGPPGTGKTYTLAQIALEEMENKRRVLVISQSNMAVDSAILQISRILNDDIHQPPYKDAIVRYGMPRSSELLNHKEYLSWDIAMNQDPKAKRRYEKLTELAREGEDLTFEEKEERRRILNQVSRKEEEILGNASIAAMTATKATINKLVYQQQWDTVIFDEVSMAYVSQVMIAASMATQKLVLVGDFKQLPPIVQSEGGYLLRKDIFSYLHVVDATGHVRKHPWLVMLDVQWRMHQRIMRFINTHMYDGRLKIAPEAIMETQQIAKLGPFPDSVFSFVDYEGLQATCFNTTTGSRFNVFSAILSVRLALLALRDGQQRVGVITPYSAQSQLINALLRDIEEDGRPLPVYCSTVHQFQGSEQDVIIFDTVENLPKKETGIILSVDEDSSMKLINVALTRARGKFILVGDHAYLTEHKPEFSSELWALIETARKANQVQGAQVRELLFDNTLDRVIEMPESGEATLSVFLHDLDTCRSSNPKEGISYWHAPRIHFDDDAEFSFQDFVDHLKGLSCPKHVFSSTGGMDEVMQYTAGNPSLVREAGVAVKDDFVLIASTEDEEKERHAIWFNLPSVFAQADMGERVPYALRGRNTFNQFVKLSGVNLGLFKIAETEKKEKAEKGAFAQYLSLLWHCGNPDCKAVHSGVKLLKAKSGKYYVACDHCGKTLSYFVPNDYLQDYVTERHFVCKTCGKPISISRKGYPYCTKDYTHKVGYSVNDIIEQDPSEFQTREKKQKHKSMAGKKKKSQVIVLKADRKRERMNALNKLKTGKR